ncbi:MAG: PfkB family carbohydrate kinase [Caldilineales bacterium]
MDLITLSDLLVDMFPAEVGRRLADVSAFYPKPGGASANVAVAAQRLGVQTAFIGKVGEDAFGHHLVDVLRGEGVETRGIRFDREARTTMAVIALPTEHHAEFVFYRNPGADQRFLPAELDRDLIASARALHVGALSLTDEPSRSAAFEAVRVARAAGAMVSFDTNYRPSLWESPQAALAQYHALIPQVNLLKVNETELGMLVDGRWSVGGGALSIEQAAGELLARGPSLVVVTLGRQGSHFQTAAGGEFVPGFDVTTVDAVGCGDAFIAGVLAQILSGGTWRIQLTVERLRAILRYANAVGALTATQRGAIPAMPIAAEVDRFLAER